MNKVKNKHITILGLSIWRLVAYFAIYSFIGYLIETVFAFGVYGVVESRQSFLYGPFCSIYGVGATMMILFLRYFTKNNHTLFFASYIVGSIIEYLVSLFGEMILNTRWWDYTGKFLSLNGRICFTYSLFWGGLGVYLMKVINPRADRLIDFIKEKCSMGALKFITIFTTAFLLIDCVASIIAIDAYYVRKVAQHNLDVKDKAQISEVYRLAKEKKIRTNIIDKYWNDEKMVKTYPNMTITLKNGESLKIRTLSPEIKYYYYRYK